MDIKSAVQPKIFIRLFTFLLAVVVLFIFSGVNKHIDHQIEDVFYHVKGESMPDTNIVIIHLTESDIDKLGQWPIKRSYYALLINSLTRLGVKKIGLEIFLSAKLVTQTLYDQLLTKEIQKSGNVVLSSLAGEIKFSGNGFVTDSLSYPSPKLLDENIETGHINYIKDDDKVKIPIKITAFRNHELAFSVQLSNLSPKKVNELDIEDNFLINVNFHSSWTRFKNYGWLDFFELLQKNDSSLQYLKDKIVIIGVSDRQLSPAITTIFDDYLPGVALHAFALDNLLNNNSLNDSLINYSKAFFLLTVLVFLLFNIKRNTTRLLQHYAIAFFAFIVPTFFLFSIYELQFAYSWFIIPILFLVIADSINWMREKKYKFESAIDEASILKSHLTKKEVELEKLQKELDVPGENRGSLINKIKSLKSDIDKLRLNEEDEVKAEKISEEKVKDFYGIIYRSKIMIKIIDLITKTAPEEANILVLGESGTGKELVARAIHTLSKRKDNKFIAVNCGALSESLLESELFGHVKGAFTGALNDKVGRFEAADNGTIFLDEIAETNENFQVKLLRVIQTGEYEKVGSSVTQKTNLRIVAATNKNLELSVKEKKFREDLYYRLNVIKIELPPLRDRKDDIEILAQKFLERESAEVVLSQAASEVLNEYGWKGNVRELEAVIKRASIFCKAANRKIVQLADLPEEIVKGVKFNFEDLVLDSLREKKFSHSSITETANELGNVSRTLVSENFRGAALKVLVENDFDLIKTVEIISSSDEEEVREKVKNKIQLFVNNIESDIKKLENKDFESVKTKVASKYKNLPQKFHSYLDEIIKNKLSLH